MSSIINGFTSEKFTARWLPLVGVATMAALKLAWLGVGGVPFNSDEAVVGLMARHILQGERPIFFYGQAYLGSLDAWFVAGAFAVFGESVLAIRLVQIMLYALTLLTTYHLALKIYANVRLARIALVLLVVPTPLLTLYTTATLGGYGETLVFGNSLLLLALDLSERERPTWQWILFGFLGGLGFWTFPLIIIYLIPAIGYVLFRRRWAIVAWLMFLGGALMGASPWLVFTFQNGWVTVQETGGSAIAGASPLNPIFSIFGHTFNFLLFGLTVLAGVRPPWRGDFIALPLAPLPLALYTALFVFIARHLSQPQGAKPGSWLLLGVGVMNIAGFILTPFGVDPSGRYFLPLAVMMAVFMAEMLTEAIRLRSQQWIGRVLALCLVAFNFLGNAEGALTQPPGITTQFDQVAQVDHRHLPELIQFLRDHGETRGYTNYWVEFPLAFLTQEEMVFVARLPYHEDLRYTPRDSRYAPYEASVRASARVAYITTQHLALDERLRTEFAARGVAFSEQKIGDYQVFYALSRPIAPEEMGLGVECCATLP